MKTGLQRAYVFWKRSFVRNLDHEPPSNEADLRAPEYQ
jgi:hypothetical protein